jgi:hypothetical protein
MLVTHQAQVLNTFVLAQEDKSVAGVGVYIVLPRIFT